MKNERGITLISLTIAIVVIFILSGVVIYSGLFEDGGIINKAKEETFKTTRNGTKMKRIKKKRLCKT